MSERNAFGPNLRRIRIHRGISLEQLAEQTKISVELWEGLERNDFSRWPRGIYARAYVRAYALEIGVDPDATVNDFCRWFPQGDRRTSNIVRQQAALVGHALQWNDDLIPSATRDRRASMPAQALPRFAFTRAGRFLAAIADLVTVFAVGAGATALLHIGWGAAIGFVSIVYHAVSLVTLGSTPAVWVLDTFLSNRTPAVHRADPPRVLRVLRGSER